MEQREETPLPYAIAYEDDSLLIVDKPQGLATAPGKLPSLCEALFRERPGLGVVHGYREQEGGLLNRLDNETGGLVFFAKNEAAFSLYSCLMKKDEIEKRYMAVIKGALDPEQGKIALPIGHSRNSAKRMVVPGAKRKIRGSWQQAVTHYRTLEKKGAYSLLDLRITRGVRHQIRVHLAAMGSPVWGDKLYTKEQIIYAFPCHLLYAYCVCFPDAAGNLIQVEAKVPFLELWERGLE